VKRVVVVAIFVACGGDDKVDVPDSGYGQNTRVPTGRGCSALCGRAVDCTIHLCNEDTMTSGYGTLRASLEIECNATCDEAAVAQISDERWSCMFTDSCRMVLQDDSCDADGYYTCE